MKNVQMPTSKKYHDFLVESLKEPEEAASYIEGVLEEGKDEPQLLQKVLKTVVEAYAKHHQLSESAQPLYQNLDEMITEKGCDEIVTFVNLLNALGLQLAITVKSEVSQ